MVTSFYQVFPPYYNGITILYHAATIPLTGCGVQLLRDAQDNDMMTSVPLKANDLETFLFSLCSSIRNALT